MYSVPPLGDDTVFLYRWHVHRGDEDEGVHTSYPQGTTRLLSPTTFVLYAHDIIGVSLARLGLIGRDLQSASILLVAVNI